MPKPKVKQLPSLTTKWSSHKITKLWDDVSLFIYENVELTDVLEYDVLTGWLFANRLPHVWNMYPYLFIHGIYKSGKSRLMDVLKLLSLSPITSSMISVPALYRILGGKNWHTMFVDEFKSSYSSQSDFDREIMQVLNSGYKKGGGVIKCVGKDHTPHKFSTTGFKAVASIFPIPDTLRSRSILIRMRKTTKQFPLHIDEKEAEDLKDRLHKCTVDISFQIKNKGEKRYNVTKKVEDLLFQTSNKDGRLVEIFHSIYLVAPNDDKRDTILRYLKEVGNIEIQEQLASFEGQIFQALYDVCQHLKQNWFSVKAVSDMYNSGRGIREQIKTRTVGKVLKTFGLKPYRTARQKGFKYEQKLMDKLLERYPLPTAKQQP